MHVSINEKAESAIESGFSIASRLSFNKWLSQQDMDGIVRRILGCHTDIEDNAPCQELCERISRETSTELFFLGNLNRHPRRTANSNPSFVFLALENPRRTLTQKSETSGREITIPPKINPITRLSYLAPTSPKQVSQDLPRQETMCRGMTATAGTDRILPTILEKSTFPTMSTTRKQAFLKRSLAHRTVSFVENEVEKIMSTSAFMQSTEARSDVAPLQRHEIQKGELVGQGGFSEVYQLTSLNLGDAEADHDDESTSVHISQEARESLAAAACATGLVVKHLRKDLLPKRTRFQTAAADLVTEAQFLARIDHPNIIKLRGWTASGIASLGQGQHDGFFIVMDKIDCTLAEKIQEWQYRDAKNPTKISHLETKLRYARELASALEYLHERRLVFRDLKPENIGILNDSVVLFDFGLCRELPESSNLEDQYEMSGVGTLRYMAPEILMRQKYNQKADIYSLSMVFYEMFFHSKPFDLYTFDMHQLLVCEEQERPHIPSYCPSHLRALLEDTWDPEPLDRPSLREVRKHLKQSLRPSLQFFFGPLSQKLHKSFSFGSTSEHTSTTAEESSLGSWFLSSN